MNVTIYGFRHSVEWWGLPTPPGMGPGSRSGCFGLPNWVLGCTHGLRASARALGAGSKALLFAGCPRVVCWNVEAGGQSPGRVPGVTPWGLSVACRIHAVTG